MNKVYLNRYQNSEYKPGSIFKRSLWYIAETLFFHSAIPFPSAFKCFLLHLFGAKVGKGVVIKPNVHIKYPWFLEIGNFVWIGEGSWFDSLDRIVLGDHVVVSQGAYLLTGSHDYKKKTFDLRLGAIVVERGVWIGAKAVVCPGVICGSHSVLTVGSIATNNLEPYGVYQGNPATLKRKRVIQ